VQSGSRYGKWTRSYMSTYRPKSWVLGCQKSPRIVIVRNFGFPLYWFGYLAAAGFAVLAPLPGRLPEAVVRATLVMVVAVLATWVIERKPGTGGVSGAAASGLKVIAVLVTTLFFMATCSSVRFEPSSLDALPMYWDLIGIVTVLVLSMAVEASVGRILRRPFGVTGWFWRKASSSKTKSFGKPI
jgi:hypothetical protein